MFENIEVDLIIYIRLYIGFDIWLIFCFARNRFARLLSDGTCRMNCTVFFITLSLGFLSVTGIFFLWMSRQWLQFDVWVESRCTITDIREIDFQFFDETSAIDLSCSKSVMRIIVMECDDVCGSLGTILRSSHDVQVFCGDVKCVCILCVCVCLKFIIRMTYCLFSYCVTYFFRSFPLAFSQAGNHHTFHRILPPDLPHLRQ